MYALRKAEAHSCNPCRCGRAIIVTHSVCVCARARARLAPVIQYMHGPYSHPWPVGLYAFFHIIS
jgi:hypothetical protein